MAAGFKTGVPTTTGVGQGSAQVFAPTAPRVLDTTALQRGVGAIVDADAANKAAKAAADKKAKEDKDKADADRFKSVLDAERGNFTKHIAILDVMDNTYLENLSKADTEDERDKLTLQWEVDRQGVVKDQEARAEEFKAWKDNPNRQSYVDGKWTSYYDTEMNRLNESPTEFELERIKDGTIGGHLAITGSNAHSNTLTYDPKFNPQTMTLDMFIKWAGSSETSKAYLGKYSGKEGTNIETIIKDLPEGEEDNFREWMKQQEIEKLKWATNSAIENGYPPYVINDPQFKKELDEGWNNFVDGMILPSQKETSQSTKKNPTYDKDAGKPKDFKVNVTTMSEKSGRGAMIEDIRSTMKGSIPKVAVSADGTGVKTNMGASSGDNVEAVMKDMKGDVNVMTVTAVGTGKDLPTITIGETKGIPERIWYDNEGNGFTLMKVPVSKTISPSTRFNKKTGEYDVVGGDKKTVMELKIAKFKEGDLKKIQDTYGYKKEEDISTLWEGLE